MLHAGKALAGADGAVERIVGGVATECLGIIEAEAADGVFGEQRFAHRDEGYRPDIARGALAFRIESANGFKLLTEKVKAQGRIAACRIKVDQAPTDRILASFADRRHAEIAVVVSPGNELFAIDDATGGGGEGHGFNDIARHDALDQGIDGGEDDCALGAGIDQLRQGCHTGRNRHRIGGDPVIGKAVPCWESQHRMAGKHGFEDIGHALQATTIARNKAKRNRCLRRLLQPFLDRARKHRRLHAVGEIGQDTGGAVGKIGHLAEDWESL